MKTYTVLENEDFEQRNKQRIWWNARNAWNAVAFALNQKPYHTERVINCCSWLHLGTLLITMKVQFSVLNITLCMLF